MRPLRTLCWLVPSVGQLLTCGASGPPDVVLITLDTTRVDHLGAYGYRRPVSPALDRFAREAVVLRRAWSPSPWTLPAHASLLTGKHPTSHGAHYDPEHGEATLAAVLEGEAFDRLRAHRLAEQEVTLAEVLASAGYQTAAFVGGPWLAPAFGLLQGYETQDADVGEFRGRSAAALSDRAIAWIEGADRERPIHLLVNYFDPHEPYEPRPGFDDLPGAKVPLRLWAPLVNAGRPLPPAQRRAFVDRYDGEIRFMDHHLGRLLEALRRTRRFDDALVVIVADHGELLGEHGFMGHGRWLYEELLRVPLLIHFPGARGAGTEVPWTVSLIDVLPLVAKELGLEPPPGVEGLPLGQRRVVLAESFRHPFAVEGQRDRFDRDLVAVIRWPWKLIVSSRGDRELYRLDEDPFEARNRVGAEVEAQLDRELKAARGALSPPEQRTAPRNVPVLTRKRLQELGYAE